MSDQIVEVAKDDLMRDIKKEVEASVKLSEERVMSILADKIGKAKADAIQEAGKEFSRDLEGLEGTARAAKVEMMRNRAFDTNPGDIPDKLREEGWGRGMLFSSYAMLLARCAKEYGRDQAPAKAEQIALAAGNHQLARAIAETRTLQAGEMSGAGALIPELFSSDFIEMLRSSTVVRRAGAMIEAMPGGTLDIGRQNTASTANWVGELGPAVASQPSYGRLKLSAKKLMVKVPVSNDAMRRAGNFSQLVTNDMIRTAGIAEDAAFLRGSGTANVPTGMKTQAASGQFIATAGATFTHLVTDLTGCLARVYGTDVDRVSPAFFCSSSDYYGGILRILTAGGEDARWLQDQFVSSSNLFGIQVLPTTGIPKNLGGGHESELYLLEASQFIIGETLNLRVEEFNGGAYTDASSATVLGVDTDETVLRLIHEVDCALRHTNAVAGVTGVNYALRA
jgi:HK97 family phage major capsid protein